MPIMGLGLLHVLVAVFFAVHAVRSGQQLYWLVILFMFPALGSAVYFFAVYLPDSRLHTGARRAVSAAGRALDPGRDLREAKAAFEFTPTAQNQMRLAAAQLAAGDAAAAAVNYDACLKGPFASDLEIQFRAARAFLESGRAAHAVDRLDAIRAADPSFRAEEVSVLRARSLAASGRGNEAKAEFEAAHARYAAFDVRAEYAIYAHESGDTATAARLEAEIREITNRWNRHTRALNAPLLDRLAKARR